MSKKGVSEGVKKGSFRRCQKREFPKVSKKGVSEGVKKGSFRRCQKREFPKVSKKGVSEGVKKGSFHRRAINRAPLIADGNFVLVVLKIESGSLHSDCRREWHDENFKF